MQEIITQEIDAEDLGFLYGFSLFETFLADEQGKVFLLEEHIARIVASADFLQFNLKLTAHELQAGLVKFLADKQVKNEVIRLTISAGNQDKKLPSAISISRRKNPYSQRNPAVGFNLQVASQVKNTTSPIIRHKTANYLENYLLAQGAKSAGFDDVLFLNEQQQLTETSRANIFFVTGGVLYTPDLKCGLLPGVIRAWVLRTADNIGLRVEEGCFDLEALFKAEEVFLTNSVIGIMPVMFIDDQKIGTNTAKPVTKALLTTYQRDVNT